MGFNSTRSYPRLLLLVLHPVSSGGGCTNTEVWDKGSVWVLAASYCSVLTNDPPGSHHPLWRHHLPPLDPRHCLCKSHSFIYSHNLLCLMIFKVQIAYSSQPILMMFLVIYKCYDIGTRIQAKSSGLI